MPIDVEINDQLKLVIATVSGTMRLSDMVDYQLDTWSLERVVGFDEVVDVLKVESFEQKSIDGLKELAGLSARMDSLNKSGKFAIVATDDTAAGLGKMYELLRNEQPSSEKEVRIFGSMNEARAWLGR